MQINVVKSSAGKDTFNRFFRTFLGYEKYFQRFILHYILINRLSNLISIDMEDMKMNVLIPAQMCTTISYNAACANLNSSDRVTSQRRYKSPKIFFLNWEFNRLLVRKIILRREEENTGVINSDRVTA